MTLTGGHILSACQHHKIFRGQTLKTHKASASRLQATASMASLMSTCTTLKNLHFKILQALEGMLRGKLQRPIAPAKHQVDFSEA